MAWFPSDALRPGVTRREVAGWAMYDFANSGYTTVVQTAVFNAYFVGVIAGGAAWGTLAWTLAMAAASVVAMVAMPLLGAYADAHRRKKRLLALATIGCAAATLLLAFTGPGDVWLAGAVVALASACFAAGEALIAAFLPQLARPEALGRLSGWGWSLGYFGGMLALGLSLGYVLWAQAQGLPATHFVPVTLCITAALYLAASAFTFRWLTERSPETVAAVSTGAAPRAVEALEAAAPTAWRRLRQTLSHLAAHRSFTWLLACAAAYQAGISVVVALAAIYAEQALGFSTTDTMALIFVVNIASAVGAFAFGYTQDRIGPKPALALTLLGWLVMTGLAYAASSRELFWGAAVLAGLCMGTSQSVGRAMAAELAPLERSAEFFGLWTVATRVAAILGPITYGLVTWATDGDHRLAILSTGLYFALGLLLLVPVRMPPRAALG